MYTTTKIMNGEVLKGTQLAIAEANKYKRFQINYNNNVNNFMQWRKYKNVINPILHIHIN